MLAALVRGALPPSHEEIRSGMTVARICLCMEVPVSEMCCNNNLFDYFVFIFIKQVRMSAVNIIISSR